MPPHRAFLPCRYHCLPFRFLPRFGSTTRFHVRLATFVLPHTTYRTFTHATFFHVHYLYACLLYLLHSSLPRLPPCTNLCLYFVCCLWLFYCSCAFALPFTALVLYAFRAALVYFDVTHAFHTATHVYASYHVLPFIVRLLRLVQFYAPFTHFVHTHTHVYLYTTSSTTFRYHRTTPLHIWFYLT